MKAPNKIYLSVGKGEDWAYAMWTPKTTEEQKFSEFDEHEEYIRKDALLEWLKERYSSNMNLPHDIIQEPIMQGYMGAISDVINKLNSL